MYKNILGDCFLLKLTRGDERTTVLIDCGVIQGVSGAKDKMNAIARDIVKECGGDVEAGRPGRLDLLVVTHEHWDHISGFGQAADIFFDRSKLEIGRVWMAWTEDPEDELASELDERFHRRKKAVAKMAMVAEGDQAHPFGAAPSGARTGLEAFVGPLEDEEGLGFGSKFTGRVIMEKLREASVDGPRFLTPGEVVTTPGPVGLRTYVLGPPRDKNRLFKDLPSSGDAQETYLAEPDVCEEPLVALAEGRIEDMSEHSPFARPYRQLTRQKIDERRARAGPPRDAVDAVADWLQSRYFADLTPCRFGDSAPPGHSCAKDHLCQADQARRRIDNDWLAAAGPLALKLDSDTNNTSLVLAFELPGGDVLLFAADAQVGNWLSWHDQKYRAGGRDITAEDILARTVLYKVGHHGSHNATLRQQGLELMRHPRLAAMIPVVESIAAKQPGQGWKMPFPHLKEELLTRTSGRILRGDCSPGQDLDEGRTKTVTSDAAFLGRVEEGPEQMWVEYRITG